MRQLWLVRHGPTHQKAFTGWRDVPADLSDTTALARLDAALPRPATLISSDLIRASNTADAIGRSRRRLADDHGLREFDFGLWDGLGFADVVARDPALSRRYWETPGDVAPPGGESWNAATARIGAAIDCALAACDGPLIVVAHFGAILTQISRATGRPAQESLAQNIAPLSRSCIEIGFGGSDQADACSWRLREVNVTV